MYRKYHSIWNRNFIDNASNGLSRSSSGQYRNRDESSIYTRATGSINGSINQQVIGIDDSLAISLFHIGLISSP